MTRGIVSVVFKGRLTNLDPNFNHWNGESINGSA